MAYAHSLLPLAGAGPSTSASPVDGSGLAFNSRRSASTTAATSAGSAGGCYARAARIWKARS